MNVKLLLLPLLTLAACSSTPSSSRRNSPTLYLHTRGIEQEPNESSAASTPLRHPPKATPLPTVPAPNNDPLRAKRTELLTRIEELSHDECDFASLRLELVPRERMFDRDINPKKLLLRYTRRVTSREDLEFIERTLNDRR